MNLSDKQKAAQERLEIEQIEFHSPTLSINDQASDSRRARAYPSAVLAAASARPSEQLEGRPEQGRPAADN